MLIPLASKNRNIEYITDNQHTNHAYIEKYIVIIKFIPKEGYLPKAMGAGVDLLEKFGRIREVSEFENTVRAKKGMS